MSWAPPETKKCPAHRFSRCPSHPSTWSKSFGLKSFSPFKAKLNVSLLTFLYLMSFSVGVCGEVIMIKIVMQC